MKPRKLKGWPGSIRPPSSPRNSSMLMNVTRAQSSRSAAMIRARTSYWSTGPTGTMAQGGRPAREEGAGRPARPVRLADEPGHLLGHQGGERRGVTAHADPDSRPAAQLV